MRRAISSLLPCTRSPQTQPHTGTSERPWTACTVPGQWLCDCPSSAPTCRPLLPCSRQCYTAMCLASAPPPPPTHLVDLPHPALMLLGQRLVALQAHVPAIRHVLPPRDVGVPHLVQHALPPLVQAVQPLCIQLRCPARMVAAWLGVTSEGHRGGGGSCGRGWVARQAQQGA